MRSAQAPQNTSLKKGFVMVNISRKGTFADHGTYHVELTNPKYQWDAKMECIVMRQQCVTDYYGVATHNYRITIPLEELVGLLKKLSSDGIKESGDMLREELVTALPALIQLAIHVAGVGGLPGLSAAE